MARNAHSVLLGQRRHGDVDVNDDSNVNDEGSVDDNGNDADDDDDDDDPLSYCIQIQISLQKEV